MPRTKKIDAIDTDYSPTPVIHEELRQSKTRSYAPLLVVLLLVASYLLGVLTTKIQYIEKGGTGTAVQGANTQPAAGAAAPVATNDDIKKWAKEIGLDTKKFDSCFDDSKFATNVTNDQADGTAAGVSGTPTFYVNGVQLVGAQPYSAFQQLFDQELAAANAGGPSLGSLIPQANAQADPNVPAAEAPRVSVDPGHLPALGNKDAKITIVEFSDFECPFCKQFEDNTFPQIKKDYIDTGIAVLYFRHFPLSFHPMATPFANASECANEQGKFWEMHEKIFGEQG